ncbi:MAG: hypothetical protein NVSMB13_08030 [Mycobacteriales bacterium]
MGAFEEAKGKIKEKVGDVTDNSDLQAEGKAQNEKGEAERKETQAKAEAQAHEKKAESLEQEQKQLQDNS